METSQNSMFLWRMSTGPVKIYMVRFLLFFYLFLCCVSLFELYLFLVFFRSRTRLDDSTPSVWWKHSIRELILPLKESISSFEWLKWCFFYYFFNVVYHYLNYIYFWNFLGLARDLKIQLLAYDENILSENSFCLWRSPSLPLNGLNGAFFPPIYFACYCLSNIFFSGLIADLKIQPTGCGQWGASENFFCFCIILTFLLLR